MILPFLIIILLLLSLYLSFLKDLDFSNQVIITCLAIYIFNLTINYTKRNQLIANYENFNNQTDLERNKELKRLEDMAEEITIVSPPHETETKPKKNNTDIKEKFGTYTINGPTEPKDLDLSNYDSMIVGNQNMNTNDNDELNGNSTLEVNEYLEKNQDVMKSLFKTTKTNHKKLKETFYDTAGSEEDEGTERVTTDTSDDKADDTAKSGNKTTTISQSNVKGTASIFTPQIIINHDGFGGVGMKQTPNEPIQPIFTNRRWNDPESDIFQDDDESSRGRGRGKDQTYLPDEIMKRNMRDSYRQHLQNQGACGGTVTPLTMNDYINNEIRYGDGYVYINPKDWDLPTPNITCTNEYCEYDENGMLIYTDKNNVNGIYDKGTPINVIETCTDDDNKCYDYLSGYNGVHINYELYRSQLEYDENGEFYDSEKKIRVGNVGSIMPKFCYNEVCRDKQKELHPKAKRFFSSACYK